MARASIVKTDQVRVLDRGHGIQTIPLITHQSAESPAFTTGISTYPPGEGAPLHSHNCPEQVTLLEGQGEVEIDGEVTPLRPYDSTYIPGGGDPAVAQNGSAALRVPCGFASIHVTRTFADSGKTGENLVAAGLMGTVGGERRGASWGLN